MEKDFYGYLPNIQRQTSAHILQGKTDVGCSLLFVFELYQKIQR